MCFFGRIDALKFLPDIGSYLKGELFKFELIFIK